MSKIPSHIVVYHKKVDGLHVFTSPMLHNLHVAHSNPLKAFTMVQDAVNQIACRRFGEAVTYTPEISFEDFFDQISGDEAKNDSRHAARHHAVKMTKAAA